MMRIAPQTRRNAWGENGLDNFLWSTTWEYYRG